MKFPALSMRSWFGNRAADKVAARAKVDIWYPLREMGILNEEATTGAWQRAVKASREDIIAYGPVYASIARIVNDVAKLRYPIVELGSDGVKRETWAPAFSPVLERPNPYQRIQKKFFEQWMASKLTDGNAYILKVYNERGTVSELYVLDPMRVRVYVAPGPSVFYRLRNDNLAPEQTQDVFVPASHIIHDRMNAFYHPLVGLSPLRAAYGPAAHGLAIQRAGTRFFDNNAMPGGIVSVPANLTDEQKDDLKKQFQERYSGLNQGKVAVLTQGMEFKQLSINPGDAQLIDQLKLTVDQVLLAFGIPPYILGIGNLPPNQTADSLNQLYYSACLQTHIEDIEGALDEGLSLPDRYYIEADLDGLLRMDASRLMETLAKGAGAGILAPNEARRRVNLPPVAGGESPYMQEQNWSLADLAERRNIQGISQPKPINMGKLAPIAMKAPLELPAPASPETDISLEERMQALFEIEARRMAA